MKFYGKKKSVLKRATDALLTAILWRARERANVWRSFKQS
jgi:hypothetical protein